MTVQIPLKAKYRRGFKSRNKGGENAAPKKHRSKLNAAARKKLPDQPNVVLVVNGKTGHGVFMKE